MTKKQQQQKNEIYNKTTQYHKNILKKVDIMKRQPKKESK